MSHWMFWVPAYTRLARKITNKIQLFKLKTLGLISKLEREDKQTVSINSFDYKMRMGVERGQLLLRLREQRVQAKYRMLPSL